MKYFYDTKKYDDAIDASIKVFIEKIKTTKKLHEYVDTIGITGTAARGQAYSKGSDIDIYCITKYLNPLHEHKLQKVFASSFSNIKIDHSLLVFAPSVHNKPDLMYYEFTHCGIKLYGNMPDKISINKIPQWEGIRLLTFKGNPFLASLHTNKFDYNYAKLLLGIGEAFLVLNRTYVADSLLRQKKVVQNKILQNIEGFIEEYNTCCQYKFHQKMFDTTKEARIKKGLVILQKAWDLYLRQYCDSNQVQLKKIKPSPLQQIASRLFYTINYYKYFRKIKVTLSEPFIKEIQLIQEYLNTEDEKLRRKICESWKVSPRFWYSK